MSKIAIIEDDAILRDILANKLFQNGFEVVTAEDGEAGLALIEKENPALVLLDILLPKKNGLEILTSMRSNEALKNTPVIAISNTGEAGEVEQIKSLGVSDFLIKALFDSADVVDKVQKILGQPISVKNVSPAPSTPPPVAVPSLNTEQTQPPIAAVAEEQKISQSTPGSKKILIVEDDKFLRELASQKLSKEGFEVLSAQSGKEGVDQAVANIPGIIILDLILPGMDGFEVLTQLKANEATKNIPVIILSNMGQEEDIEKAKRLGATDYLVKAHFSFGEIIKKINEVLK